MTRPSLLVLAFSSLLGVACHRASSGAQDGDGGIAEIGALRDKLFAVGIQPLPDPPFVSDELFELGQALFFDKILSGNQDVSCATCHLPEFATGDGRNLADGVHGIGFGPNRGGGMTVPRNSPPLFALHLKDTLFWDGRVRAVGASVSVPPAVELTPMMRATFSPGLEVAAAQAMLPPVAREEMRGLPGENPLGDLPDGYNSSGGTDGGTAEVWIDLTERLLAVPRYIELLRAAYPAVALSEFTFAHVGNAIAAFEVRGFARMDSAFERFVRGDDAALSREQVLGAIEFFDAGCAGCHSGSFFSDQDHHNIGLPQFGPGVGGDALGAPFGWDVGRENVTRSPSDRFEFRTASLLNVELTGPYGHAGQFAELRDFVAHYRDARASNQSYDIQSNVFDPALVTTLAPNSQEVLASLDPRLQVPIDFDVDAIVTFLRTLTAESARDLSALVPASVPSGLPVF